MGNYAEIIIGCFMSVIIFSVAALVVNATETALGKSSLPKTVKYWICEILAIMFLVSIGTPFFYACWKSVMLPYSFDREVVLYAVGCSLSLLLGHVSGRRS